MKLTLSTIANVTNGTLYGNDGAVFELVTDSRKVTKGCLFAALKGERVDGHDFIKNLDSTDGIAYLVSTKQEGVNNPQIVVDNVLVAIGEIARAHLDSLSAKKVAITGSVGKTTTKEFIKTVLETVTTVHYAKGNFNNELGLPLTALGVTPDDSVAVLEMGMRGLGQIDYLCNIAKPDVAVITNIGISHIELLGSRENILKAKLEIVDNLSDNGVAVLNGDDDMLVTAKTDKKTLWYGINNKDCDILAKDVVDNKYTLRVNGSEYPVTLGVLGVHNVYNSLAAIGVALSLGFDIKDVIKGVESFTGDGSRQSIYDFNGVTFFDDTYNASPDSMKASMSVFKDLKGQKVLVLANMFELGELTKKAHIGLKDAVNATNPKCVILIGEYMKYLYDVLDINNKYYCDSNEDALKILKQTVTNGDAVLFKGSNGMKLANLVTEFKKEL